MRVTGLPVSGVSPLNGYREGQAVKGSRSYGSSGAGQVKLSGDARALYDAAAAGVQDVRPDLVAEARGMIESGTLESDANIDAALDRLMAHLF